MSDQILTSTNKDSNHQETILAKTKTNITNNIVKISKKAPNKEPVVPEEIMHTTINKKSKKEFEVEDIW
jgi:hypothetical protein